MLTNSREIGVAACLLLATLAVYWPVRQFHFVSLDDLDYVAQNEHVRSGLSAESVRWALFTTENANWFPLTRLSYLADRQFFEPRGGLPSGSPVAEPFHWTNVLLHSAATLLLFGFLRRTTGALWPSTFVAFLFALHPQHVESVAWVAERKDVLSAVFWMLALWSYASYARRPNFASYLLTLTFYGLGFLAKPMVVTLPAILLLMDIWPLRRFPVEKPWKLVREKAPFLVMAVAMAVVTVLAQQSGGAVRTLHAVPLGFRFQNAFISGATYVVKTFWPTRLAVFYPMPASEPLWQWVAAGLALAGITVWALASLRTRPYLTAGWFWYLVTLLPVIGIVQVGDQMRADRYTYIPTVGIAIVLGWGGAELCRHWPMARRVVVALTAITCFAWAAMTWRQLSYWEDSETLWQHTLAATENNAFAHACMGNVWKDRGLYDAAISEYRQSLAISPGNPGIQDRLGETLYAQGRTAEAVSPLLEAVKQAPDNPDVHSHLGMIYQSLGRVDDAAAQFASAVRLKPDFWEAHIRLGNVLESLGRTGEANEQFAKAFQGRADSAGKDR